MPLRHRKDRTGLIARKRIRAPARRHYVFAYLWSDRDSMRKATEGMPDSPVGTHEHALALHCPNL